MSARRRAYAALGAALSLGAPLGLLAVRALQAGELSAAWIRSELAAGRATYGYVCFSTLAAFALFGYLLGKQADRLIELSMRDSLTGLHNRRALFEQLGLELTRAARYQQPLSLLLIDVDGLKALNDRDGHRAGDSALGLVAAAVRAGSRASDLPARWGGDEFALVAPNTGPEAAAALAERVRALVAARQALDPSVGVTISIGFSTVEPGAPAPDMDALVRRADAALYEAKRAGRNRVVSSPWPGEADPGRPFPGRPV